MFGHTEMQELLAFSSIEVRFLVDSSKGSNKRSYKCQSRTVMGQVSRTPFVVTTDWDN